MSKGVLVYCYSNERYDYTKLCDLFTKQIHKHLNLPVTMVTDKAYQSDLYDNIIIMENDDSNMKRMYGSEGGIFRNTNRFSAYEVSPYDETLLLDADYLVFSNSLEKYFNSKLPVRLSNSIITPYGSKQTKILHPCSIEQYWATVIYFNKSNESKLFFDMMEHVKDNYTYFSHLYRFDAGMFRNDFVVSISAHVMNGMVGLSNAQSVVGSIDDLLFVWEDEVISIGDSIKFRRNHDITYTDYELDGIDVHCINKQSLYDNGVI